VWPFENHVDPLTAGAPFPGSALVVLAIWLVLALGVAARTFQWE